MSDKEQELNNHNIDYLLTTSARSCFLELPLIGLIFYFIGDNKIPHGEFRMWCLMVAGASIFRLIVCNVSKLFPSNKPVKLYFFLSLVSLLASGILWGYFYWQYASVLTPFQQHFFLAIVIAVAFSNIVSLSGSFISFYSFVLPMLALLILSNINMRNNHEMAILALVFVTIAIAGFLHFLNSNLLNKEAKLSIYKDELDTELNETKDILTDTRHELDGMMTALNKKFMISKTKADGEITFVNDRFCQISGYQSSELIGQSHKLINSGFHSKDFFTEFWRAINSNDNFPHLIKNKNKRNQYYWVSTAVAMTIKADGEKEIIAIQNDLTESVANKEKLLDAENSYMAVTDNVDFAIFKLNTEGQFIQLNKPGLALFKLTKDDFTNSEFMSFVDENNTKTVHACFAKAVDGENQVFKFTQSSNNKKIAFSSCFVPLKDEDDKTYAVWGFLINITKEQEAKKAMDLAAKVYKYSSQAMIVSNADNAIIAVNPAFTELTGYTAEEVHGKNNRFFLQDVFDAECNKLMQKALNTKGHWRGELRNKTKTGANITMDVTVSNIGNAEGIVYRSVTLIADVTDLHRSKELIQEQERKIDKFTKEDSFRGTLSRPVFYYVAKKHLAEAPRPPAEIFAFALIEIKNLDDIIKRHNHNLGHEYIQELTSRINQSIRRTDYLAQFSDDVFALLLTKLATPEDSGIVMDKIYQAFSNPIKFKGVEFQSEFNIGISVYPNDGDTVELLEQKADLALYKTKDNDKATFNFYSDEIHAKFSGQQEIYLMIEQPFENNFTLFCQPTYSVSKDKFTFTGGEFLLRVHSLVDRNFNVADVISVANKRKAIENLGLDILDAAFSNISTLKNVGTETAYSINLAVSQISPDSFISSVTALRQKYDIDPSTVIFELDESEIIDVSNALPTLLRSLRSDGYNVAVDSFSQGYTLLAKLSDFPVNILKIDSMFIKNMMKDKHMEVIVKNIIHLAKGLEIKVVAKGVETKEQFDLLTELGCDEAQGYYLGKELSMDDFVTEISKSTGAA